MVMLKRLRIGVIQGLLRQQQCNHEFKVKFKADTTNADQKCNKLITKSKGINRQM